MELIGIILSSSLLFFALYGAILVVSGSFYRAKGAIPTSLPTIKVLLPAYQPDEVFLKVLESLKIAVRNHPIDVLILFQEASEEIIDASKKYGFPSLTKNFGHLEGNSYRHALQFLCDEHLDEAANQYTIIFDKDNLVDANFFDSISRVNPSDYHLIQGARKPIKTTEGVQLFDAISERYNDLMLRKGKLQLGGTLEVSGSAALIKTNLFKHAIKEMDEQAPGYDKNFMVKLLTSTVNLKSIFVEDAFVVEEKTAAVANYQSQRLRWFGEQYFNAFYNFKPLLKAALNRGKWRSLDYWITLVRPPRSLQLVASFALVIADLFDGTLGYLSLPFLFNALCFALVTVPIMKHGQVVQLVGGSIKVLTSNLITSITCMKKKYQNTFIHTR